MRMLGLALLLAGAQEDVAPDFSLKDLDGRPHSLATHADKKVLVLVFTGIECPRAQAVEPRLAELAKTFGPKGVAFLAINPNRNESDAAIAAHLKSTAWPIPVLRDPIGRVAASYGVSAQPTAVVIAGARVRYRGLIDDHKIEELVRRSYVKEAVEALLAGKAPAVASTVAQGCAIRAAAPAEAGDVTYARDVAPILNKHCLSCHRPGQVGLFSLEGFEQASAWSKEIANVTGSRRMPPWKPTMPPGTFHGERRLSENEIAVLDAWFRAGAPLGDPKELPPAPAFNDGWTLGTPDLVLSTRPGDPFEARGRDEFRLYRIDAPFKEDRWISGLEFRPLNPRPVRRIIGFLDPTERRPEEPSPFRADIESSTYFPKHPFGEWSPGYQPGMLPEGVGRLWRKGERLVLKALHHRTGRPEEDPGIQVGLYFSKSPPRQRLRTHLVTNIDFQIPAGPETLVTAAWKVPQDIQVLSVTPHMHLLGRSFTVTATPPNGAPQVLLSLKDWDFNWQETYRFAAAVRLPSGTEIKTEARYDNSPQNLNNPRLTPSLVIFGDDSTDEMCVALFDVTSEAGVAGNSK